MDQWHEVWIVSWTVVLGVLVGIPLLWNLVPSGIREPIERRFESSMERVSPAAALKRAKTSRRAASLTRQSSEAGNIAMSSVGVSMHDPRARVKRSP
jgi:hypothetical protein